MNSLVKVIEKFFYRDIFFILSGSIFLFIFYFGLSDVLPPAKKILAVLFHPKEDSNSFLLIAIFLGVSYTFGFLIQELSNTIKITSSNPPQKGFRGFIRLIFRCNTRREFEFNEKLRSINFEDVRIRIYGTEEKQVIYNKPRIERFTSLKQIGTTVGPSIFFSGLLLIFKWDDYYAISIFLIISGTLLILFGWVKLMEQTELILRLDNNLHPEINENQELKNTRSNPGCLLSVILLFRRFFIFLNVFFISLLSKNQPSP